VTAVALALAASVAWGLGDYLGGFMSRRLHVLTVLAVSQVVGFAAVLVWAAVSGDGFPGLEAAGWAVAAGVGGCLGLASLYRGMAVGAMAIVAPISAVSAAIPFIVGVASGERPSALQLVGVALALAGVALASREPPELGGGRAAGVGLALLAAAGFGAYYVCLDQAADESVAWAVATARGTSSLLAISAALVVGVTLRPGARFFPAVAAVGLCDVGANVLVGLALTRGYLSVVSVLASLYPVVTVALASVLLRERIARPQLVGVSGALTGAALITAG
jgi:drug/metabolite transporter (DMT)-like permease